MAKVKQGDKVKFHFAGTLPDGRLFDSSDEGGAFEWLPATAAQGFRDRTVGYAPAELIVGEQRMMPAFEAQLVGMEPGEEKTFTVPFADAYGPRHPEWVIEVPRTEITPAQHHLINMRVAEGRRHANTFKPQVGDEITIEREDGVLVPARVKAMSPETITVDANHPLSGFDLTFKVRLVEICGAAAQG